MSPLPHIISLVKSDEWGETTKRACVLRLKQNASCIHALESISLSWIRQKYSFLIFSGVISLMQGSLRADNFITNESVVLWWLIFWRFFCGVIVVTLAEGEGVVMGDAFDFLIDRTICSWSILIVKILKYYFEFQ